ncbi:MAG: hypothetical protein ACHRXM_21070 [Isosphaerales bacterium]
MSIAPLVLFAAMAAAPAAEPDPTALVAKLGSAEPAERAAASESLRALGRGALPALQGAMKAGDAGVRERASALWETIQRDLMTRPSMVRLDGRDRPLSVVLEDLETQTGLTLRRDPSAPDKHVTLREPAPVAFWTALERLGLWGIYYHNPGEGQFPRLELREAPAPAFTSTDGPFRVSLTGLHLHRDRQWIRGPWVRIDRFGQRIDVPSEDLKGESVTFFGGLEVMVEPRMWFTQEAPARLTEASDDLGQSLVPDAAGLATRHNDDAHFAFRAGSGVAQVRTEFRLRPTDHPGRVARLRGGVPVMLHVRRPEPTLVIPLADAAGKTFRCDDAAFTIRTVNDSPTATNVSMTVRLNLDQADLPANADGELITTRLRVMGEHQLQLTDAAGTVLAYSTGGGYIDHSTPSVYNCTIGSFRNGRATHLRYYSMLRVRSEAAFDFRDVPLP